MEDKIKEYVDTDEVPQDNVDSKNEGGGGGNSTTESKETDKSLWYVAGFLIGLVILAIVLAII